MIETAFKIVSARNQLRGTHSRPRTFPVQANIKLFIKSVGGFEALVYFLRVLVDDAFVRPLQLLLLLLLLSKQLLLQLLPVIVAYPLYLQLPLLLQFCQLLLLLDPLTGQVVKVVLLLSNLGAQIFYFPFLLLCLLLKV